MVSKALFFFNKFALIDLPAPPSEATWRRKRRKMEKIGAGWLESSKCDKQRSDAKLRGEG